MLSQEIERVTLDLLRVAAQRQIGLNKLAFLRNNLEIYARVDDCNRRLVIELMSHVLAGPTQTVTLTLAVPADWWQAVRERFLPKWWLRRWPVRYRVEKAEQQVRMRCCPHMDIKTQRPHLEFLMEKTP